MRAELATAAVGMLLMLAACGTAAASHTASRTAPSHTAGPPAATIPATPAPDLTFTCRMGGVDQNMVTVPYAAPRPLPAGAFLPDTQASWAAETAAQDNDATGLVVTVTNRTATVIPVGAVAVQPLTRGQPYGGPVTTSPDMEAGIGSGETWTFADTFTDAGGTVVVSERTYLHSTCTASVPVSGTLG